MATFIIDCPECKAKVGADEKCCTERKEWIEEADEPWGQRIYVGTCPSCETTLVGVSWQVGFEAVNADEDSWQEIIRVYPKPPKQFSSHRIPNVLKQSLEEADLSMQAGANSAACVMFGRALEALCNDVLKDDGNANGGRRKRVMLATGIKELRERKIIDERLFDWSQHLRAFRNLAAHAEDISITRQDAEDLQAFVYAITEYIYDLTDRYTEFKERLEQQERHRRQQEERRLASDKFKKAIDAAKKKGNLIPDAD